MFSFNAKWLTNENMSCGFSGVARGGATGALAPPENWLAPQCAPTLLRVCYSKIKIISLGFNLNNAASQQPGLRISQLLIAPIKKSTWKLIYFKYPIFKKN